LFAYKYLAVTLGGLAILGAHMYKKMMSGRFARVYKHFALVNAWLYVMYIIGKARDFLFEAYYGQLAFHLGYLAWAAAAAATFFMAFAISRIRLLSGLGTKILSIALYAIGILAVLYLNFANTLVPPEYFSVDTPALGITLAGTAILAALGILSVLAARDLVMLAVTEWKRGAEFYPLAISGYFIMILTQNLVTQFGLSFSSAAISVIYVLTALAWILFGFARRYSLIRLFGLGLAILAVIKLFLVDLHGLTQGHRAISYFALGATLIAISFVYQHFNKRLEAKEVPANAKNGA
jgi:hypothetical protein